MIEVRPVSQTNLDELSDLFCSDKLAEKCWCMWHIIAVKAFHAGGAAQNRAQMAELVKTESTPVGLLAYQNGRVVGWCAVGPRERYARAIKTPTYRHKGDEPFANVWLVPCFLTKPEARGQGVSQLLLTAAVALAQEHGAQAVDGFPFASGKRRSGGTIHVGFESVFLQCGFEPIRRPSDSRVVMRRILSKGDGTNF